MERVSYGGDEWYAGWDPAQMRAVANYFRVEEALMLDRSPEVRVRAKEKARPARFDGVFDGNLMDLPADLHEHAGEMHRAAHRLCSRY